MSLDDTITTRQPVAGQRREVEQGLDAIEPRRFRGRPWLPADEVAELCRSADDRLDLLRSEFERARRDVNQLLKQVEMYRHGVLSTAVSAKGPDPMAIELTMRAQEEANRTLSEASAEGAEIINDARSQAAEIVAQAHRHATELGTRNPPEAQSSPDVTDLLQRIKDLEAHNAELVGTAGGMRRLLRQWAETLAMDADVMRQRAVNVNAISNDIRALSAED